VKNQIPSGAPISPIFPKEKAAIWLPSQDWRLRKWGSVTFKHSPLLLSKAQERRKPSSSIFIIPIRDCRMGILKEYGFLDKIVERAIAMMTLLWNHSSKP